MTINNTGGQLSADTSFHRVKTFNDVRTRSYVEIVLKKTCHGVRCRMVEVIIHRFEIRRMEDPALKKLLYFKYCYSVLLSATVSYMLRNL